MTYKFITDKIDTMEKLRTEGTLDGHRDKNWNIIKNTIENFNTEQVVNLPSVRISEDQDIFNWENSDIDINPENGFVEYFEQKNGIKVEISRIVGEEGLHILADAVFSDSSGREIFRLSNILPKRYIILEEAKHNHDFMLAGDAAVIVMAPNFLCSIEGRMRFLHELGHAFDYEEEPRTKDELLENLKGFSYKKREENAWMKAKGILRKIQANGLDFLPKGLEETVTWKDFEKEAVAEHKYKEESTS